VVQIGKNNVGPDHISSVETIEELNEIDDDILDAHLSELS
jgi:hypothetical protein